MASASALTFFDSPQSDLERVIMLTSPLGIAKASLDMDWSKVQDAITQVELSAANDPKYAYIHLLVEVSAVQAHAQARELMYRSVHSGTRYPEECFNLVAPLGSAEASFQSALSKVRENIMEIEHRTTGSSGYIYINLSVRIAAMQAQEPEWTSTHLFPNPIRYINPAESSSFC